MSAHPQGGHYDEGGYGPSQNATDSYYQDDQAQGYYDQNQEYPQGQQGAEGYYDEAYVSPGRR